MKIKILLGLALLVLSSCSQEDAALVNETKVKNSTADAVSEKELDTIFESYGTIEIYEHNRISKQIWPNGDWELNFTYNETGDYTGFTQRNSSGQLVGDLVVGYDNLGRIISKTENTYYIDQNRTSTGTVTYTYNNDNTVTVAVNNNFDDDQVRVYYLDNAGKMFKVTKNGITQQEIEYSGNNITKIGNTNYYYDSETIVKGQYLNRFRNQFSNYSNFIMYYAYLTPTAFADNYIIKADSEWDSGDYDYTYEFDQDGYPISQSVNNLLNGGQTVRITYK